MNASAGAEGWSNAAHQRELMGLASLMTAVFHGDDLTALRESLLARAARDAGDANALMDLSILMQLHNHRDIGLSIQREALQIQRLYHLPATRVPASIRLLAIMAPGDISTNMPLEFLLRDSGIALDMLYLLPGEPLPDVVSEHDVLIIAAGESDANRPLLLQLAGVIDRWPRPVLNLPQRILNLSRDAACKMLRNAPGIVMPVSRRIDRATLAAIGDASAAVSCNASSGTVRDVSSLTTTPRLQHDCHRLAAAFRRSTSP